jgi:hypothetical protein
MEEENLNARGLIVHRRAEKNQLMTQRKLPSFPPSP